MHYRRKKRQNVEPLKVALKEVNNKLDKLTKPQSKTERLGGILSSYSQFLMLIVVVFGYIYTVIPVLQKEQISEQLAGLEGEKKTWDTKIDDVKKHLYLKQSEVATLESEKRRLSNDISLLEQQKAAIKADFLKVQEEHKGSKKQLSLARGEINKAKSLIVKQLKDQILGNQPIPHNYRSLLSSYPELSGTKNFFDIKILWDLSEPEFTHATLSTWEQIKPIKSAEQIVADLEQLIAGSVGIDRAAKEQLLNEYKDGMRENANLLVCPSPEPKEWLATFDESKALINTGVSLCVDALISSRIEKESWSEVYVSTLKETDFWESQSRTYQKSCRALASRKIRDVFSDKWQKMNDPCRERIMKLNNIILEDLTASKLKTFGNLSPPSLSLIKSEINQNMDDYIKSIR